MLKSKIILPTMLTILIIAVAIILYLNSPLSDLSYSNASIPQRVIRPALESQMSNLAELTDFSTDILQIHVLESRVEYFNTNPNSEELIEELLQDGFNPEVIAEIMSSSYQVLTIYTVVILEVFQGGLEEGAIFEIFREGGYYDGYYWVLRGQITFELDQKYFVFLRENRDGFPHVLSAGSQGLGAYYVPSNYENLATSRTTGGRLRSAGRNGISLTLQDLANIAENNRNMD